MEIITIIYQVQIQFRCVISSIHRVEIIRIYLIGISGIYTLKSIGIYMTGIIKVFHLEPLEFICLKLYLWYRTVALGIVIRSDNIYDTRLL